MNDRPGALRRRDVQRRFDRAAAHFESADFVHRAAADGLFERMLPIQFESARIIDLGCATGQASRALAKRHRRSKIISVDISGGMLKKAGSAHTRWSRISEVQADANALPFASGGTDLVFANLLLPWIDDVPVFLDEIARVLRQGGLFVFSTLGPDSLIELRRAWQNIDSLPHVNQFIDMHDLGDALLHCRLHDPVLDVDKLTVNYRDIASLIRDLSHVGARNSLRNRRRSLTAKGDLAALRQGLEAQFREATLPLQLEIVYGHAWGSGPPLPPGEYRLDATRVTRRR